MMETLENILNAILITMFIGSLTSLYVMNSLVDRWEKNKELKYNEVNTYIVKYIKHTKDKNGHIGKWFYIFVSCLALTIVSLVLLLLIK